MQRNETQPDETQRALYEQFARIARALANPVRIELLDLLSQRERSVDELAQASAMRVGNTSAQLQVLKAAGLVEARRDGARSLYRPASDSVYAFVRATKDFATERLAGLREIVADTFEAPAVAEPVTRAELLRRMQENEVVVIDVRPAAEYEAGHVEGAISLPLEELPRRIRTLPRKQQIVAYCRGPYCVLAPKAVELLHARGYDARPMAGGFPEWRGDGLPVAAGSETGR